ncbi:MAG TPA: hypothetical protein VER14_06490, partial [Phototrophicaceae bacterium]|nr:hypothetical protein [Phototrophicaceae bacterium]
MTVDKLVIAAPQMMDPHIASTAKMGLNTFSNNSTIIILYLVTKKNRCLISLLYVQGYTCGMAPTLSHFLILVQ